MTNDTPLHWIRYLVISKAFVYNDFSIHNIRPISNVTPHNVLKLIVMPNLAFTKVDESFPSYANGRQIKANTRISQ